MKQIAERQSFIRKRLDGPELPAEKEKKQKPKKHLNQTFLGNFVDRKFWGKFGQ